MLGRRWCPPPTPACAIIDRIRIVRLSNGLGAPDGGPAPRGHVPGSLDGDARLGEARDGLGPALRAARGVGLGGDGLLRALQLRLEACDLALQVRRPVRPGLAAGVGLPDVPPDCEQSYHLFYLILPSPEARDALIDSLAELPELFGPRNHVNTGDGPAQGPPAPTA